MISRLFSTDVVTVVSGVRSSFVSLLPEEEACIAGASAKRRQEFALGRALAREALAQFDLHDYPLVVGADRSPVWPPGVVGSISHCHGLCGVAVARRGRILSLGLDLEVAAPLPTDVVERVCTPTELRRAVTAAGRGAADWPMLVFTAKESLYKAVYPLTRTDIDFQDVEITISQTDNSFTAQFLVGSLRESLHRYDIVGRIAGNGSHVGTGVTVLTW